MKKTIPVILICLLLTSLTAACGSNQEPAKTISPEEVTYYLREYTDEFGGVIRRTVYTYDDQWRMTSWVTSMEGSDKDTEDTQGNFTYSNDNRIMTFTVKGSDVITEFHYTFDEKGNTIRTEEYENGVQYKITDNEYDSENRLISSESTYPLKEYWLSTSQRNTYDASGNQILEESEILLIDGTGYTTRKENAYDDQGRILQETYYVNSDLQHTYAYTYSGNTMTRTSTTPGEESAGKLVYIYDDHGNQLRIEAYGAEGELQYRQVYTYIGTDGSTVSGE